MSDLYVVHFVPPGDLSNLYCVHRLTSLSPGEFSLNCAVLEYAQHRLLRHKSGKLPQTPEA